MTLSATANRRRQRTAAKLRILTVAPSATGAAAGSLTAGKDNGSLLELLQQIAPQASIAIQLPSATSQFVQQHTNRSNLVVLADAVSAAADKVEEAINNLVEQTRVEKLALALHSVLSPYMWPQPAQYNRYYHSGGTFLRSAAPEFQPTFTMEAANERATLHSTHEYTHNQSQSRKKEKTDKERKNSNVCDALSPNAGTTLRSTSLIEKSGTANHVELVATPTESATESPRKVFHNLSNVEEISSSAVAPASPSSRTSRLQKPSSKRQCSNMGSPSPISGKDSAVPRTPLETKPDNAGVLERTWTPEDKRNLEESLNLIAFGHTHEQQRFFLPSETCTPPPPVAPASSDHWDRVSAALAEAEVLLDAAGIRNGAICAGRAKVSKVAPTIASPLARKTPLGFQGGVKTVASETMQSLESTAGFRHLAAKTKHISEYSDASKKVSVRNRAGEVNLRNQTSKCRIDGCMQHVAIGCTAGCCTDHCRSRTCPVHSNRQSRSKSVSPQAQEFAYGTCCLQ